MKEKIQRVLASEQTKAVWRDSYNSKEWREANELNKLMFGIALNQRPKCHCLEDFFMMLKTSNYQTKIIMETNRLFKIRKGIVIQNHKLPTMLTDQSSEADIIDAITKLPHIHKDCELLPENWKEICQVKEVESVEEVEETETELSENTEVETEAKEVESVDYSKMKNKDLSKLCIDRGIEIPVNSNKAKLIELLTA